MNTIRTVGKTVVVCLAVVVVAGLTGCGGGASRPPQAPALSGQSALDAQATLAVWSAAGTAQAEETRRVERATVEAAEANAQATRSAEGATAQAIQAAGATSAAYSTTMAQEATATAGAQQVAATAQAASATATWAALLARQQQLAIEATATADAAALFFQQEQANKALAARQAEIDRAAMWDRMTPWLVGTAVFAVVAVLVIGAGTVAYIHLRRTRPVQAGDTWVMIGPGGPQVLSRPPALLPARATTPLLPAPITVTGPEAPIPLPRPRQGHVLVAGPTEAGKSTAMRFILEARRDVVVLDPHSTTKDWGQARIIGAGRNYEEIGNYIYGMREELTGRYAERARGKTDFPLRTVAIDEMPSIVDALGRDRDIATIWRQWLREGRKVGLFLMVSTQSLRVKTLGIEGEGDLLENFALTLAMGPLAQREYGSLVAGMEWPAVAVVRGRPQPVVIPHVLSPADSVLPAGDLDGDGDEDAILLPPSRFTPLPQVAAKADPKQMRPEDEQRIRDLLAAGWSQRQVELDLFGYNGGDAWAAVRRVIDGDADESRETIRPSAYNQAPGGLSYGYSRS